MVSSGWFFVRLRGAPMLSDVNTSRSGVGGNAMGTERNTLNFADLLGCFRARLSLPLIAAPMFRVSGVDLVVAACRNGVIGAFPTVNCRSPDQLDGWLGDIAMQLEHHREVSGSRPAPVCPNLIVHRSNARLMDDL